MPRITRLAALFLVLAVPALVRADDFFFKDGVRVVMMGDSITEQHLYSNYVEMWTVTRFPSWTVTFRNVGIGGDRSTGGNRRFARDILRYKPTALTVDFGMNDGNYKPFDESTYKTYMDGLQGIADQAKKAELRVAWVTPQPLDGGESGPSALTGYNLTLEKFSEGVQAIADKNGGTFVDQFHPYLAVLDKARAESTKYGRITGGDPVHPGPPGQALMAFGILQGLHFPARVSAVEIDLSEPVLEGQGRNCKVTNLSREGDGLRFEREDDALPFFPEEARPILKWAPILEELNAYTLKVTGLKPGRYEVRLGDTKVAEFDAEGLARGVNLADAAMSAGPIAEQVKAVKAAVEAKNRYHHDRIFRGVVLSQVTVPDWLKISGDEIDARRSAAFEERLDALGDLDDAIRKALKGRPHAVAIAPVTNE